MGAVPSTSFFPFIALYESFQNIPYYPSFPQKSQASVALFENLRDLIFGVDNEYFRMYNCINLKKGVLAVFTFCFRTVNNKSANPMNKLGVGLALSYSFLG